MRRGQGEVTRALTMSEGAIPCRAGAAVIAGWGICLANELWAPAGVGAAEKRVYACTAELRRALKAGIKLP